MPARKTKTQTKAVEQTEAAPAQDQAQERRGRSIKSKFTSRLAKSKEHHDLVRDVLAHVAEQNGLEAGSLWSQVTDREDKFFQRRFRKQRKENDPFRDIKKSVPAYSFFTAEYNCKIAAENPDKSFGEVSKLVGQKWRGMSKQERSKYEKLAAKDKQRYQKEVEQRSHEITAPIAAAAAATPAPAATPRRRGGKSRARK